MTADAMTAVAPQLDASVEENGVGLRSKIAGEVREGKEGISADNETKFIWQMMQKGGQGGLMPKTRG